MTTPELLTPAEVAALFRVDPKTVTRWAQMHKLSSIRTVGGHRRYRAAEIYELLEGMQRSEQYSRLEVLVADQYGGDPTRVVTDLAARYGLAVAVLDRDWFVQAAGRDLTDIEWKRLSAEFGGFSNVVRESCVGQLSDYASTVLGAAGVTAQDAASPELPPPPTAEEAPHVRPDATSGGPEEKPKEPAQNGRGHARLALAAEPSRPHEVPEEQVSADAGDGLLSLAGVNRMVPHSARVWDYLLGGHDNYEIDRLAADAFHEVYPGIVDLMAAQRGFGRRAVEYLIEQGCDSSSTSVLACPRRTAAPDPPTPMRPTATWSPERRPRRPGGVCRQRPVGDHPRPDALGR